MVEPWRRMASVGIRFVRAGDADAMVGKGGVHAGDFDLRHVAGGAVFLRDRTRRAGMIGGWLVRWRADMAGQAFFVVKRWIQVQFLMRIVAGRADQARVAFCGLPAAAAFQPIGLEPNVDCAGEAALDDISPGTVTRSTEIHRSSWIHLVWIENGATAGVDLAGFHRGDVNGTRAVAGFTGDARRHASRGFEMAGIR